jgi:uncharacterized protein YbjT (DUF2867 family)
VVNRVLVTGATGGVGQLVVAKLLEKGLPVRILTRSADKAEKMFNGRVDFTVGDTRYPETLSAALQDVDYIICATGTTAFPSEKWDFDLQDSTSNSFEKLMQWGRIYFDATYRTEKARNSPNQIDAQGVKHLVELAPKDLRRFVFVSSCGVQRKDKLPYNLLNSFGVLDAKQEGELAIVNSGLPYTIIRPGQLIDGPFTSYDLNTLLQRTTNGTSGVVVGTGDTLTGQTSRIDVAAACVECLENESTERKVFELINKGTRPAVIDWPSLFAQL